MNFAGAEEDVDPAFFSGGFHRCAGGIDIGRHTAGQTANDRTPNHPGDLLHGIEVALTGDRKTRLDDIHAQARELTGHLQLLAGSHGRTGALLSVPESRVKNQDAIAGHGISLA